MLTAALRWKPNDVRSYHFWHVSPSICAKHVARENISLTNPALTPKYTKTMTKPTVNEIDRVRMSSMVVKEKKQLVEKEKKNSK